MSNKSNKRILPGKVLHYLKEMHKYYKEEMLDKKEWKLADGFYELLETAYKERYK